MKTAVNDKGEMLELQGSEWVPVKTAVNDAGQQLHMIGGQWQSMDEPSAQQPPAAAGLNGPLNYMTGVADNLVKGITFGWNDELEAGIKSLFGDKGYDDLLREVRGRQNTFKQENPKVSSAAELTGGFATGIGTAAKLPFMAAKTIPKAAVVGAAEGGLYGAGASEGDRGKDAAIGALTGGLLGPALQGGGELVGRAGRYLPDAVKSLLPGGKKFMGDFQPDGDMAKRNLKTVEDMGFRIAPGDKVSSRTLQMVEDTLKKNPGGVSPHQKRVDHNQDLAQGIVAKELGIDGPDIDLGKAKQVNSAQFEKVANSGAKIDLDEQFLRDVEAVEMAFKQQLGKGSKTKLFNDVMDEVEAGEMSVRRYMDIMSGLSKDAYKAANRGDGSQVQLYKGLQQAIDNAADRSMPKADYIDFHKARQAFRSRKTLEGRGVVNPADGSLSIPALGNAMKKNDDFIYGWDQTDLAQIGRFHLGYKSGIGDSGTPTGSISAIPGMAITYPVSRALDAVPKKMFGTSGLGSVANKAVPGLLQYSPLTEENRNKKGLLDR